MKEAKKQKKWMLFRHKAVTALLRYPLWLYCRLVYGIRVEKFARQGKRPYLVLLNHQTAFDQFFVGLAFKGPVYYVASEDLFSKGWVSALIRWLVAPIPIRKQTTDITAVMTCIRVAREGGTICIAPEGNRTYSGKTEYMSPAISGLAKKLKLPIALLRLEGGYGVHPRWSDGIRRGRMKAYVSQVIEPEEVAALSKEALMDKIRQGLFVDEGVAEGRFRSNKRAEYIERALYVCPHCGLSELESQGNTFRCRKCGRQATYGEDKRITGEFPFDFTTQWYEYQSDFINKLDVTALTQEPIYREEAQMSRVIVYKCKELLRKTAALELYGNRVVVDPGTERELVLDFETVSAVVVLGRNKLNIYHEGQIYQFKGSKRFCALKYVHIFHRYKNITKGEGDSTFLGI